jgi:hypothetical protein
MIKAEDIRLNPPMPIWPGGIAARVKQPKPTSAFTPLDSEGVARVNHIIDYAQLIEANLRVAPDQHFAERALDNLKAAVALARKAFLRD